MIGQPLIEIHNIT